MSVLDKFVSKEATLSMPITSYQVLLAQTALDERDRIVALLKTHTIYYDDFGFDCCHLCGQLEITIENHLIALIKGEK